MATIQNPVVRGTQPDPSVVRVGGDYYLATSSFDLLPGIQIRHSTNLVDWELVGAAVRRPAQYRRDGRPGPISLFAPTLRHHDGVFYLVCTNVADDQGNFVVRTTDPAGEWSDAMWIDRGAFDPSLLFDSGRCYYTRRTLDKLPDGRLGPVVQAEIDLESGALGPMRELTADYQGFCSNDIEGPHLYSIDGWYYLFSAEGGSWAGHMQTCARSRSPWGPFEPAPHNPVLTHRHRVAHPIQTLGHAELIDDVHGRWWALALGTRHTAQDGFVFHHNLGRETFLAPVEWVEGWPVIGNRGTIELNMEVDRELLQERSTASDATTLWQAGWRALDALPGVLDSDPAGPVEVSFGDALTVEASDGSGVLLLPQTEDEQHFAADLHRPAAGRAGVGVFTDRRHHYLASIESERDAVVLRLTRVIDDLRSEQEHRLPLAERYRFEVDATPGAYRFEVGPVGGAAVELGSGSARLLSAEAAEWFVGAHFALTAVGASGGTARFENIRRTDAVATGGERAEGESTRAAQ